LFVISRGSFALGPEGRTTGDNICDLLGAPVPFILRKEKDFGLN